MREKLATYFCRPYLHKRGARKREGLFTALLMLLMCLALDFPLYAQENSDLVLDLVNRVAALEAEQRDLRGQLDETHHDLSLLQKKMETLNADVDYRLNNTSEVKEEPHALTAPESLGEEEESIASSSHSSPEQEYEKARSLLEKGDYDAAEKAFSAFLNAHPKDKQVGAAHYWLGVTYFVRGMHEKAATSFAKGYKNYPKSPKAADSLLKLSKCLVALERKADACATLEQLSTDFPKEHTKEVARERENLKCK